MQEFILFFLVFVVVIFIADSLSYYFFVVYLLPYVLIKLIQSVFHFQKKGFYVIRETNRCPCITLRLIIHSKVNTQVLETS